MKKIISMLVVLTVLLSGCGKAEADENLGLAKKSDTEISSIEDKEILNVIENKKQYINTEFKEYCYLKDYSSDNYMSCGDDGKYKYYDKSENKDFKIVRWCEVDMDSDGRKEVILESDSGMELVLHSENNIVYCYTFPFRGMNSIKTDGSYSASGSAANTYIGRLKFDKEDCFYEEICAFDDVKEPICRINGKDTSKKEVDEYLEEQKQKEDVVWSEYI